MKNRLFFLLMSAMALTMVGCSIAEVNVDESVIKTDESMPVFYVGGHDISEETADDDEDTKVTLNSSNVFSWTNNDRVAIFPGVDHPFEYVFKGETGSVSGALMGVENGGFTFDHEDIDYNVAVYPYSSSPSLSQNAQYVSFTLKEQVSYKPDVLGDEQAVMVSRISKGETNFKFRATTSFVRIKLVNESRIDQPVYKIRLTSTGGEALSGVFNVDFNNGYTAYPSYYNASSQVTLSMSNYGYIDVPPFSSKDFYIAVPSQNYTEGIDVDIYYENGTKITRHIPAVEYFRSMIYGYQIVYTPVRPIMTYKEYLLDAFDADDDGELSNREVLSVSVLDFQKTPDFDPQTEGFELSRFLNVESVNIHNVTMSANELDFTQHRKLERLSVIGLPSLETLKFELGPNVSVKEVTIDNCENLTQASLAKLIGLESLYVRKTAVGDVDMSNSASLTSFSYYNNINTSSINLIGLNELESVYINGNDNLTSVTLPQTRSIRQLSLYNNDIRGILDLSLYTKLLGTVEVDSNYSLEGVVLPKAEGITTLYVSGTSISGTLDISDLKGLVYLYAYRSGITKLKASGNSALKTISAYNCYRLADVEFENCPEVRTIRLNDCALESVDISECNSSISQLYLYNNLGLKTLYYKSGQYFPTGNIYNVHPDFEMVEIE